MINLNIISINKIIKYQEILFARCFKKYFLNKKSNYQFDYIIYIDINN